MQRVLVNMPQNYLAAALRNLFRNGAYAVINIFGLSLGFAAIILIALIIALATVSGHALFVARTKPVEALRYE